MTDTEIAQLVRGLVAAVSAADPDAARTFGADPAAGAGSPDRQVDEQVEEALTDLQGTRPVRDADGDIGIRLKRTALFVHRASGDPAPVITMFAPLRVAVPASRTLLEQLNELNAGHGLLRVVHRRSEVQLVTELLCDPFVPAQLDHLVRTAAAAADALTGALAEAGHPGRTPLADPAADAAPTRADPPASPAPVSGPDERIGLYL
ncbi:MAG TPA: YbjN domain-containing protein [Frankiaceae bacterium]|nr:YbjN domain-containing protein [Frankiaceae bacterium]